MEKETLFRGKEMWAPFPSRGVSIYMREIAQIGWHDPVALLLHTHSGEQDLEHLTSNQSHWACTRTEKEEGQKNTFHIKFRFSSAKEIHRGITALNHFYLGFSRNNFYHDCVCSVEFCAHPHSCKCTVSPMAGKNHTSDSMLSES